MRASALLLLISLLVTSGCSFDARDEARDVGLRWFFSELGRSGYQHKGEGLYATPVTPASGLLLGDSLEVQVKDVRVLQVREVGIGPDERDVGTIWKGQVFISFLLREQYHQNGQARGWSSWSKETTILQLDKRGNQWYVTKLK